MIKTSASLLACDLADISGELSRCKAANVDWIHFDVMDGAFGAEMRPQGNGYVP